MGGVRVRVYEHCCIRYLSSIYSLWVCFPDHVWHPFRSCMQAFSGHQIIFASINHCSLQHSQVSLTLTLTQSFKYSYLHRIINAACALGGVCILQVSLKDIVFLSCGKCQKKVAEATEDFSLLLCIFPSVVSEIAQLLTLFFSHLLRCVKCNWRTMKAHFERGRSSSDTVWSFAGRNDNCVLFCWHVFILHRIL